MCFDKKPDIFLIFAPLSGCLISLPPLWVFTVIGFSRCNLNLFAQVYIFCFIYFIHLFTLGIFIVWCSLGFGVCKSVSVIENSWTLFLPMFLVHFLLLSLWDWNYLDVIPLDDSSLFWVLWWLFSSFTLFLFSLSHSFCFILFGLVSPRQFLSQLCDVSHVYVTSEFGVLMVSRCLFSLSFLTFVCQFFLVESWASFAGQQTLG